MPSQSRYLDFDLSITREGDRYMAEVRESPAGTSEKVPLHWPFGNEPHEVLLLKLENAILKGRGYRGGPLTSEEKILREFGSDVFNSVFLNSNSVGRRFAASLDMVQADKSVDGLRLKLRVDPPELAMLPWEYMFDESMVDDDLHSYVCLRTHSPLVRFLNVGNPSTTLQVDGPLRILGMIANPGTADWERLDTEAERHRIEDALKDVPKSAIHFEWVRGGATDDLFDSMQREDWHVFHFIGHGGTNRYMDENAQSRTEGFVVMQDGLGGAVKVVASQLALMLEGRDRRNLRLAVLNCCDSGRGSTGVSSVGAALVKSAVPITVAMQFAISNGAAARFAGQFYKSVVSGQPVEKALTVARRFMRLESNVEWAIPVLFTRSGSCVLFEVTPGAEGTSPILPVAPVDSTWTPSRAQARQELRNLYT